MTATIVAKPKGAPKVWRCGYCANGHHGSCPGAVWHQRKVRIGPKDDDYRVEPVLWRCLCEEPGHPSFPYCTVCKHAEVDEVDPDRWVCLDPHGCAARVQIRRENSRVWQEIQRAKSHAALKRKAERLNRAQLIAEVAADQDEVIDRLHGILDQLGSAKTGGPKKVSGRRPKGPGACECCGEPTRGGRFLPGHDARLASALVARIRSGGDSEAYEEMVRRGWEKKIPPALKKAN